MKNVTYIKSTEFKKKDTSSLLGFAVDDFSVFVSTTKKRSYYAVTLHFNGDICQQWTREVKGIEAANKRVKELAELAISGDLSKQISIELEVEKSDVNQTDNGRSCKQKSNRGGARVGAGRKKKQPTKLMRVPVRFEDHIRKYISELEDAEKKLAL